MEDSEGSPERENANIDRPERPVRQGWNEAAREMARRGDDALVDPPSATAFDDDEWTWQPFASSTSA
jgi:hypothetical protein